MNNIGRVVYGFCNGFFGRNSYSDKRIEAEGVNWIVARDMYDENACPEFADFNNEEEKNEYIKEWSKKTGRVI